MKAILVFIDGTICDERPRHPLGIGSDAFYRREAILLDRAVPGSAACLQDLARDYAIVYIGARPSHTLAATQEWLAREGFPAGPVYLAATQPERLACVRGLKGELDFLAGVGDRWDDNELHRELGCLSIMVREYEGDWAPLAAQIRIHHRESKRRENEIHLHGKIEGLARVLPRLHARYGEELWETFYRSVLKSAEETREERARADLASFARYGLNPNDLRDVARWYEMTDAAEWEENAAFGLQDDVPVEASERRYAHRVARCRYAELWRDQGHPEIGYQIHCRCDRAWWDRPAWNPRVRFEQPQTLMQGADSCLFIQVLPVE